jgi:hypothetical protein
LFSFWILLAFNKVLINLQMLIKMRDDIFINFINYIFLFIWYFHYQFLHLSKWFIELFTYNLFQLLFGNIYPIRSLNGLCSCVGNRSLNFFVIKRLFLINFQIGNWLALSTLASILIICIVLWCFNVLLFILILL